MKSAWKRVGALLLSMILGIFITGCGSRGNQNGNSKIQVGEEGNFVSTDALAEKEIITIGCFVESYELKKEVAAFNRNNSDYQIEIKNYSVKIDWAKADAQQTYDEARTHFYNDLVGGNAPDMFTTYGINPQMLVNKGAIENLSPYLDQSELYQREDLFDNVLQANTVDDVLYAIPATFRISTLFARSEDVEGLKQLSVQDFKAIGEKYPEAKVFPNASRNMILGYFFRYGKDIFVNESMGECYLDSQDFRDILELCKEYPSAIDPDNIQDYDPQIKSLRNHKSLFLLQTIGDMKDYSMVREIFEGPVTAVGFPGKGSVIESEGICISSSSKHKDICFRFIEQTLSGESVMELANHAFPIKKDLFEKKVSESMKAEEIWSFEDVSIKIRKPNADDVEAVMQLIEEANGGFTTDEDIVGIICEEAEPYFEGKKPMDKVIMYIEKRIKLYLAEKS